MNAAGIATALGGKRAGSGYVACCPAHKDKTPSLSLNDADDGRVLYHCHAGCTQDEVTDALKSGGYIGSPTFTPIKPASSDTSAAWALRDREDRARREVAARKAITLWNSGTPATPGNPYLLLKSLKPVDTLHEIDADAATKILGYPPKQGDQLLTGRLLLAPVKIENKTSTLELIDGEKRKSAIYGGAKVGGYWAAQPMPINNGDGITLTISEGVADALAVRKETGHYAVAALSAGNLKSVALYWRSKLPGARLIITADLGNGETQAEDAAGAANALIARPVFTTEQRKQGLKDFCDMYQSGGDLRAAIAGAAQCDRAEDPKQNASGINYRRMSSIESKPVSWLWQGRLARGKVSMIAGHPGLGKSQITVSLAAIVSTGGMWPVDRIKAERGNVIFLSAEDEASDTIRPRLEAAGADLDRIYMLDAVRIDGENGETTHRGFSLKTDLSRLGAMLAEIGNVALIIIDPITAYMGGVETHYNADVRAALAPLSDLAAAHGAAIVCVSHLNKGGGNGSDALMRVTGSIAFVAAARAAYLVVRDDDNAQRRLFLPLKNNVGNDQSGLAFELREHQLGSGIDTCRVLWETQPVSVTADQALAVQHGDRSELDEAKAFLLDALAAGKAPSAEIERDADGNGISKSTLRRAKQALGVQAVKVGQPGKPDSPGKWFWRMPDAPKALKKPEDAQEESMSTFEKHEHLREPGADEVAV